MFALHESNNLSLSVVVPVYRSEGTLRDLVRELTPVLQTLTPHYEIILVNDGSPDHSWDVIQEIVMANANVRGIGLMRNYGQHNALLCGVRAAEYDLIVTMDDDLQHPPAEIPKLLLKLAEGYDVVYGAPRNLPHSTIRNLLSKYTKVTMASAMGIQNVRNISAFRVFRTDLRKAFETYQSPNLLLDVLLSWGTTRFASVEVTHHPRRVGTSNYNFYKLFNQAMLMLTGFSTAPLRVASYIGFGFTIFGLLIFLYVLLYYFFAGALKGFTFIASTIALFSGAQLFALGIIGEYLARMFNRSLERPTYVVRESLDRSSERARELSL